MRELTREIDMLQVLPMQPEQIDRFRYWMEIVYFSSGPILAVFAALALRQITHAKRAVEVAKADIVTRSRRESVVLAAEKIEEFATETFPVLNAFFELAGEKGMPLKKWGLANQLFDSTSLEESDDAKVWLDAVKSQPEVHKSAIRILNMFEAFAIYFANGAADEQIAFPALGNVYCRYVIWLAPLLIALRTPKVDGQPAGGYFKNLVTLYDRWSARLKKQLLAAKAAQISREMLTIDDSTMPLIGLSE